MLFEADFAFIINIEKNKKGIQIASHIPYQYAWANLMNILRFLSLSSFLSSCSSSHFFPSTNLIYSQSKAMAKNKPSIQVCWIVIGKSNDRLIVKRPPLLDIHSIQFDQYLAMKDKWSEERRKGKDAINKMMFFFLFYFISSIRNHFSPFIELH